MKQKLLIILASFFAIVNAYSQNNKYDSFSVPIKVKPGAKLSQPTKENISPYRLVTCESPDVHVFPSNVPQSEVHISINKANNQSLLISSNTFPIGNSFQGAYWSNNSGATWQGDDILPNNGFGRGDPSTAYDALGRGYIASMTPNATDNPNGYFIQRTDNNGATWLPQVNATGIIPGFDKEMITADDVPASPFANNLYCAWTVFGGNTNVQFNRSTDGGNNFTNPIILRNSFGQGANVQTGPNGEVYVCWADYTNGQVPAQGLGFTRSLDGGANFNADAVAFNYAGIRVGNGPNPDFNNTRINDFPAMAVDKSNGARQGRIYVVYAERENGNGRSIIRIRWSDNRGDTWSVATTVSIPTARQSWMPWVSVDDTNGNVFVTYFCMENQNNFNTNTFVAASVNGFTTFQNRFVSDFAHVTAQIPQFIGGYAGDYIGITANGGRAFAAWMDDRNGVWQNYVSEVRAADIEFNGNPPVCGSPVTYTLIGVPPNANIIWQTPTPAGIVNISSSGNTATLTQNGNASGTVTLSAEVIDGGCSYGLFSLQITVGTQTPTNIVGLNPPLGVSPGELLELDAAESGMPSYSWSVQGGTILGYANQSHVTIQVDQCQGQIYNGWINVQLSYTNGCGTGSYGEYTTIDCGTGGGPMFAMSPNPATNNVTIDGSKKNKSIKEVQIIDKLGNVKKIVKYSGDQKIINLDISGLPSDIYYIKIYDGQKWESKQLRVQ